MLCFVKLAIYFFVLINASNPLPIICYNLIYVLNLTIGHMNRFTLMDFGRYPMTDNNIIMVKKEISNGIQWSSYNRA